jgi:hypothetical protein
MKIKKILKYTFVLFLISHTILGQASVHETMRGLADSTIVSAEQDTIDRIKADTLDTITTHNEPLNSKNDSLIIDKGTPKPRKFLSAFNGVSISFDAAGAVMALATAYGQWEGACQVNFLNTYFPILEVGCGVSNHTNETTDIHFKTAAPYFRLGCDYNFIKDKTSDNRIYGGLRFAYSPFTFDVDGPPVIDPVWGSETPFTFSNVSSHAEWLELVFGIETQIVRFFHLGWTFRYKFLLNEKKTIPGKAWYIPGYGKNGKNVMGGTFNLIFNLSDFRKAKEERRRTTKQ